MNTSRHTCSRIHRWGYGLLLTAGLAIASSPANAAFEALTFGAEPLPYALQGVTFHQNDRRTAVTDAIRDMTLAQLRFSGAFRESAPSAVTVELRQVKSSGTVLPDGTGTGQVSILYRVTTRDGRIIFNDRVHTTSHVALQSAVPLKQSTRRAARYRAYSQNVQALLRALRQPHPTPKVTLAHPLENPARTTDFQTLIGQTIAALSPLQIPDGLTFHVRKLSLRQLPSDDGTTTKVRLRITLDLNDKNGARLWSGSAESHGSIPERNALQNGINPRDAAIAHAVQQALRKLAPRTGLALQGYSQQQRFAQTVTLPFRLTRLTAQPQEPGKAIDPRAFADLQAWALGRPNRGAMPHALTTTWQPDGMAIRINLGDLTTEIHKPGVQRSTSSQATATEISLSAIYAVYDSSDQMMMITHRNSTAPVPAKPSQDDIERAMRVALLQNWAGFLEQLQTLTLPLKSQAKSARTE